MALVSFLLGLSVFTGELRDGAPTIAPLDALRARLQPEANGSYTAEFVTVYTPVSEHARQAALAHYAVTRSGCHVEGLGRNGDRVSFNGAEAPACLMNSRDEQRRFTIAERLELAWPWFRSESRSHIDGVAAATEWRVWDPSGLTLWTERNGPRPVVTRTTSDSSSSIAIGALGFWVRRMRQIDYLTRVAEEQSNVEATEDGGLRMLVRMQDALVLDGLEDMYLSNGVMVTPGYGEIAFSQHSGCAFLSATFRDCADAPILSYNVRWEGTGGPPREIQERCWVVGTADVYRTQAVRIERVGDRPADLSGLAWSPRAGQEIFDQRFGTQLHYRIPPDGRIPSDADLAVQAEARIRPVVRRERSNAPSRTVRLSGTNAIALKEAPSFDVQALHAEVSVPIVLENISGEGLQLETPTKSCSVGEVFLRDTVIAPGQSFELEARLTVAEALRNEYELSVPFVRSRLRSTQETLVISFELDGIATPELQPRITRAERWIEGRDFPCAAFTLNGVSVDDADPAIEPGPLQARFVRQPAPSVRIEGVDFGSGGWGVHRASIDVRASEGSVTACSATLLIERVPRVLAESWPGAILSLSGGFPRERRFEVPGLDVNGARVVSALPDGPAHGAIDLKVEPHGVLVTESTPNVRSDGLKWFTVRLDTSLGAIDLLVYSGPTHAE